STTLLVSSTVEDGKAANSLIQESVQQVGDDALPEEEPASEIVPVSTENFAHETEVEPSPFLPSYPTNSEQIIIVNATTDDDNEIDEAPMYESRDEAPVEEIPTSKAEASISVYSVPEFNLDPSPELETDED